MAFLFNSGSKLVLASTVLITVAIYAHAGPLPPCINATLSANGSILVVNELSFDDPDESHVRNVKSSTFRVLRRYVDPNEGLRMNGPDVQWANPIWSLSLPNMNGASMVICPYMLVTDDAEFLILVGGYQDALSIYRRRDHPGQPLGGPGQDHGILIRRVPLTDLWRPEQVSGLINDHTPEWFAGGTFSFSADNRTLTHKARSDKTFQISLETGKVTPL